MWVADTRVYFRVLERLSGLEGAREEGTEQVGQPVNTACLMVVQLELVQQAREGTLNFLFVGIGEIVAVNIRQYERFRDVIILISCLKDFESSMFLPSDLTHD